ASLVATFACMNGPDNEVIVAITIHIASARGRNAGEIAGVVALDDEALRRGQAGEIDHLSRHAGCRDGNTEAAGGAEDDIGPTRLIATIVTSDVTHKEIGIAVTVDVASRRHAVGGLVPGAVALDDEAL